MTECRLKNNNTIVKLAKRFDIVNIPEARTASSHTVHLDHYKVIFKWVLCYLECINNCEFVILDLLLFNR